MQVCLKVFFAAAVVMVAQISQCKQTAGPVEVNASTAEKRDVIVCCDGAGRPVPNAALMARIVQGIEVYGIVHWGLNTYSDREWGYGDDDPEKLNPSAFDADKIVDACAEGGLQGLIVVAKHHDGFCLWPTKTTEYNISKSPFRGGKGDYVKEMEQACRRRGMKFGVYVSPWDRNSAVYGTDKYVTEVFQAQLKELLGGAYGEVFEMWFDGANGGDGWYGGAKDRRRIPAEYYRFETETMQLVRKLQPKICFFAGDDGAEFRWPGNERGMLDENCRATIVSAKHPSYSRCIRCGNADGCLFRIPEADFPLRRGWFYHENQKGTARCGEYLMQRYLNIVGNSGTMNIGISPDKRGLLADEDVAALRRFAEIRKEFFEQEVKDGGAFNVVVMTEDVSAGELVDGWELVADGKTVMSGTSIGFKRIRVMGKPISAKTCELKITKSVGRPRVVTLRRYFVRQSTLNRVMNATTANGETDTVAWMQRGKDDGAKSSRGVGTLEECPVACAKVAAVKGHEASLLPKGRKFNLVWHDEFDGDRLDDAKWGWRTNFWGVTAHWFAVPEDGALEVKDGLLRMRLVKRPDGQFVSPQLQTAEIIWDAPHVNDGKGFWPLRKRDKPKFMHRYGYYECRCRLQQKPGWWSAFWMQAPMQGCSLDPRRAGIEHDIMESFEPGRVIAHCFHMNGYGEEHARFTIPRDGAPLFLDRAEFHTFGLLWEPDGYTVYVDGRQHGAKVGNGKGEAVSETEEFILLTTEAKGYRNNHMTGKGSPALVGAVGDEFLVDFVRVFDVVE